jgi:hypothetical protein
MRVMMMLALMSGLYGCDDGKTCDLTGSWDTSAGKVSFDGDGTFAVAGGPKGSWQVNGRTLTVTDATPSCSGLIGTYTISADSACGTLKLTRIKDACSARASAMDGLTAVRGEPPAACADLSGAWKVTQHCQASQVNQTFTVTQTGCAFTTSAPFAGWSGTIDADDIFKIESPTRSIVCTGTFDGTRIASTCLPSCAVSLQKL